MFLIIILLFWYLRRESEDMEGRAAYALLQFMWEPQFNFMTNHQFQVLMYYGTESFVLAISFKESDSYYSVINLHHPHVIKDTFPPSLEQGDREGNQARVFQCCLQGFISKWMRPYGHIKLEVQSLTLWPWNVSPVSPQLVEIKVHRTPIT